MVSGPDFTNLGVTNPTTGKPVFLSSGEIAQVMGATGGVAQTPFAAATKGLFQGIETGQAIEQNVKTMEGQDIQNQSNQLRLETQQQTQDARTLAINNQNTQAALAAQMETTKLQQDNQVLGLIRNGDVDSLNKVISDPNLMLSAIDNDKYIQAAISRIKATGGVLTPDFQKNLDIYNRTRDIYAQGPLTDAYQTAAGEAAGTTAFQQLYGKGGYDPNELLQNMRLMQETTPLGRVTNLLVGPDGRHVEITNPEELKTPLSNFFAARNKVQTAGKYTLPIGSQAKPFEPIQLRNDSTEAAPQIAQATSEAVPTSASQPESIQTTTNAETTPSTTAALPQTPTPEPLSNTPGIKTTAIPGQVIVDGVQHNFPPDVLSAITGQAPGSTPEAVKAYYDTTVAAVKMGIDPATASELGKKAAVQLMDLRKIEAQGDVKALGSVSALRLQMQDKNITAAQLRLEDQLKARETLQNQMLDFKKNQATLTQEGKKSLQETSTSGIAFGEEALKAKADLQDKRIEAARQALQMTIDSKAALQRQTLDAEQQKQQLKIDIDNQKSSDQARMFASQYSDAADQIDAALKKADDLGYPLGESRVERFWQGVTGIGASPENRDAVNQIQHRLDTAAALARFAKMEELKVNSGLGTMSMSSETEDKVVDQMSGIRGADANMLGQIRDVMKAKMTTIQDIDTITRTVLAHTGDAHQAAFLAHEYTLTTAYTLPDADGYLHTNPLGEGPTDRQSPIKWTLEKLGIASNEQQKALLTATPIAPVQSTSPESAPLSPKSGTTDPFGAPSQEKIPSLPEPAPSSIPGAPKTSTSATNGYRPTSFSPDELGSNEATLYDQAKIAHAIENGQGVDQFKSAKALPRRMNAVTPDLIARVIQAESTNPKTGEIDPKAKSPTGAVGVMQLMPETGQELANELRFGDYTPEEPKQNIRLGTHYLNERLDARNGNLDLALADYNAGPGNVNKALRKAGLNSGNATLEKIAPYLPQPDVTGNYVKQITGEQSVKRAAKTPGILDQLNPFAATEVQAEEVTPQDLANKKAREAQQPTAEQPAQEEPVRFDAEGRQIINIGKPTPLPETSKAELSPRGIPPPAEIDTQETPRAKAWKESSPLAKWMEATGNLMESDPLMSAVKTATGEIAANIKEPGSTTSFRFGEAFANAYTMGWYDEMTGTVAQATGGDYDQVVKGVRESQEEFTKQHPYLKGTAEILGFVGSQMGSVKLLKGLGIIPKVAGPNTAGILRKGLTTTAQGIAYGAARGAGENAQSRSSGAIGGGVIGGGLAAGAATMGAIPAVGTALTIGAGVGALADPKNPIKGALEGAGIGLVTGVIGKFPVVQQAIGMALNKLNNYYGLKTLGSLVGKLTAGKTPEEMMLDLTPAEKKLAGILSFKSPTELQTMLTKLGSDPKSVLFDVINSEEVTSFLKTLRQVGGQAVQESAEQVKNFANQRVVGQENRINDIMGTISPEQDVETIASEFLQRVKNKSSEISTEASAASKPLYDAAFGPPDNPTVVNSPELKELFSKAVMKDALKYAKSMNPEIRDLTNPASGEAKAAMVTLSDQMVARLKAGEDIQSIVRDIATEAIPEGTAITKYPDNSLKVLDSVRQALRTKKNEFYEGTASNPRDANIARQYDDAYKALTKELFRLSPELENAVKTHEMEISHRDALNVGQMNTIKALADGNIEAAVDKVMKLPVSQLQGVVDLLGPDQFKAVVRGHFERILQAAKVGGSADLSKNLITKADIPRLNIILGEEETQALIAAVEKEQALMKGARSLGGGSDTMQKSGQAAEIQKMTGEGETPLNLGNVSARPTLRGIVANLVNKVVTGLGDKPDSTAINEFVDILVGSRLKGVYALSKVLKASSLSQEAKVTIEPHLAEIHELIANAGRAERNKLVSDTTPRPKRKKK